MIERTEKFFLHLVWFFVKKIELFLGVNSDLTVQKRLKIFTYFQFSDTVLSNIYQRKKTRASYHSRGLKYLAAKVQSFSTHELYLSRPLCWLRGWICCDYAAAVKMQMLWWCLNASILMLWPINAVKTLMLCWCFGCEDRFCDDTDAVDTDAVRMLISDDTKAVMMLMLWNWWHWMMIIVIIL